MASESERERAEALRSKMAGRGVRKALIGVGLLVALPFLHTFVAPLLANEEGAMLPFIAGMVLYVLQGGWLVYRGWRQRAIAKSGEVTSAKVLQVLRRRVSNDTQSLSNALLVEIEVPSESGDGALFEAKTLDTFTEGQGETHVGKTIPVFWSQRFPDQVVTLL